MQPYIKERAELELLWKRGTDFFGTEYAILGGAMSWISERNLVSAISNAGAFGVLAGGVMSAKRLSDEIEATKKLTTRPFGVNIVTLTHHLDDLIDVCGQHKVKFIVFAGGIPKESSIRRARNTGAKIIAFAPALGLAKRLIRLGVDALVIEGSEAGGHIGPVSLNVLAQEILPHVTDVPVFVAGGIGRGETALSYLEQGASGVQLGTLFAASEESIAHANFKAAFKRANSRDASATVQLDERFPIIPVRGISNTCSKDFMRHQQDVINRFHKEEVSREDAQMEIENFWAGALRRAVIDGDVENGSLMAGQSVGLVKEIRPVRDIVNGMVDQILEAMAKRKRFSLAAEAELGAEHLSNTQ